MAQCATVDGSGFVVAVAPAASAPCSSLVLIDASEYATTMALQIPAPADLATVFMFGFALVVGSYVGAWGFQVVLSFIAKR